ncbi:MAG: hypothetical protein CMF49_02655 [Legionellales bacterium]|nr:hypothetical protein [Legionellales bacterium]
MTAIIFIILSLLVLFFSQAFYKSNMDLKKLNKDLSDNKKSWKNVPDSYDVSAYNYSWKDGKPLCHRCCNPLTWYHDGATETLTSAYDSLKKKVKKRDRLRCDSCYPYYQGMMIHNDDGELLDSESVKLDPLLNPNKS